MLFPRSGFNFHGGSPRMRTRAISCYVCVLGCLLLSKFECKMADQFLASGTAVHFHPVTTYTLAPSLFSVSTRTLPTLVNPPICDSLPSAVTRTLTRAEASWPQFPPTHNTTSRIIPRACTAT
ncbi:hypothetical protein LZ32DRAFT_163531 [Colletotrichum eremochloae]|nr:hypothetical protein LZ32DRAFT_163531 [Colletotrichum eremochloae]